MRKKSWKTKKKKKKARKTKKKREKLENKEKGKKLEKQRKQEKEVIRKMSAGLFCKNPLEVHNKILCTSCLHAKKYFLQLL